MSVEAPIGGMSVGVAASLAPAMGGGPFSVEMASGPSFAGSSLGIDKNGGSFTPGVSTTSLFAETSPFSASLGSVREGTIKGITGNFLAQDGWTTLATADKVDTPLQGDVLGQTTPFMPLNNDVLEKVPLEEVRDIFSNKSAWEIVSKAPEVSDMQPGEWISVVPKDLIKDVAVEMQITEYVKSISPEDLAPADRVAELLVDVGIYSKGEAKKRVDEIVREANGISLDEEISVVGKIEVIEDEQATDEPEAAMATEDVDSVGTGNIVQEQEDLNGEISPKDEKKSVQDNFVLTTYAVDDKAQEERRKSFNARAGEVFNRARYKGQETINVQEVAQVNEEAKHRSELLDQVELRVPDGSFDQDIKDIGNLGEFEISLQAEQQAINAVGQVLEKNVAVKAVRGAAAKPATEKDAEKVFRFTKNTIISTIPSK